MVQEESGFVELDMANSYSTSTDQMLTDFYIPTMEKSIQYDRAVGYFSSSLFALIPLALTDFVARGGKLRILCSPFLTAADAEVVADLPRYEQPITTAVAQASLRALVNGSSREVTAAKCLSALIGCGALELKFIVPQYGNGLFHNKLGIFREESGRTIVFTGSANESAAAWSGHGNHEQIIAFRSWLDRDAERCLQMGVDFDELWEGNRRGLVVTPAAEAGDLVLAMIPPEPIDDILKEFRAALAGNRNDQPNLGLRPYQNEVLDSWRQAGRRGIVAFATGGGKTRTALEAVREWTADGKPAVILVPTRLLHDQWAAELSTLLPEIPVLMVGAGHPKANWVKRLRDYLRNDPETGPRVVLSTYQSAVSRDFIDRSVQGPHLLVVADEVHTIGAPDTRSIMRDIDAGARLGLSATPERFGDPAGTDALFSYFGKVLEPRFGIAEALNAGVLVPYEYDIHSCSLNDLEQEAWDIWTDKIARALARDDGIVSEQTKLMLIQRARILKSAARKSEVAFAVLAEQYRDGDRWLIYCADLNHLRNVRQELEPLQLPMLEYHSQASSEQSATLDYFQTRGGVLLAIKCLDEGIDIPLINKAMILASSSNPREYIQRRGRVLRRSPGKYSAHLFDILVLDADGVPVSKGEIDRADEFANHSMNVSPSRYLEQLRDLMDQSSGNFLISDDLEHDEVEKER